ncbi:MAG: DEAD/DEAH box helicase [Bacteroidota bacterium]|nr:DEAD/DEAH box helicase [Bacteroidota bacterium]
MKTFEELGLPKPLQQAINDMAFEKPTPIQEQAYPIILSGKDLVGVAQTGTGKTFAYMLPILQQLKFSKQVHPRVLILVPTRELVTQVVEDIQNYTKYMNVRVTGVYGEANINVQKQILAEGTDILIATPGRLYDLVLNGALSLKEIRKLVIDEVDVMLDLGFRPQLTNILDLLPGRRQNLMFSATMTTEVAAFIDDFFVLPTKISIALSGTPLNNISQTCYPVKNFYTKLNLLVHLLRNKNEFQKVLVFVSKKKVANRLYDCLGEFYGSEISIIHSNKSQNYRLRSIEEFENGASRILIATDVISRGLDLHKISHVISFDTPEFPENYMHRIGRTGRAEQIGKSILFYSLQEEISKDAIEALMCYKIPVLDFPAEVEINNELSPEEKPLVIEKNYLTPPDKEKLSLGFHEKSAKNKKVNLGGSYKREIAAKYKKPRTRGDKNLNNKNKRKS